MTRQDIINDPEGKKYHVQIQPYDGYTWVDENAKDNYATKLKEKAVVTNTPVKTENEQSTAAPEKQDIYTQAAQEMQDILDGKGEYKDKDIVEKYKAIEKRFQKAYDEFNKPAEGSNIIKIRDQAFTNVIEYLQNDFALTKPLGKEVLFSHFKKLADYKNIFPKKI